MDQKLESHIKNQQPTAAMEMEKLEESAGYGDLSEALDWRGRPATARHGGPKTSFFILTNQGLWNVAIMAVATNLVLYFRQVLHMNNAVAANNVTNWFGTTWLLALVGGFLGDSYLGRFWTCVVFQIIHVVGLVLMGLSVTIHSIRPDMSGAAGGSPTQMQVSFFFVAIYIVALGTGGLLPAFMALGADQYDSPEQRTTFFAWLFSITNIGSIVANTLFVYLENSGRWTLSYWLAAATGLVAVLAFAAGMPWYRQFHTARNPFTRMAQVAVAATRKWKLAPPSDEAELFELGEKEIMQQGSRKMPHTPGLRCFDKAAMIDKDDDSSPISPSSPWRLCSVTQVEEIKCVFRMLPIWLTAIPFSAVITQINTLFVEQATMMDRRLVRRSWEIPPASMSVLNVISIFVTTVSYPYTIAPLARAFTGRPEGLTSLQRLGVGQVVTAAAMAIAAAVESRRLVLAADGRHMSVWWLAPQEVIMGVSQVLGSVGAMDFFYSEAPHSMRGLVSSLSLANLAIGSYASTLLVSVTMHFTTAGGRPGWISPNLNDGHVDYFYCLLLFITLLNVVAFAVVAVRYRHHRPL